MSKTSESRLKAIKKYDFNNCIKICFKFNLKTDYDIIEQLNMQENKQGYIKQLIRADIFKNEL